MQGEMGEGRTGDGDFLLWVFTQVLGAAGYRKRSLMDRGIHFKLFKYN